MDLGDSSIWRLSRFLARIVSLPHTFFNPEKLYTPFTCTFKRLSFSWISVKGLGSKPYTQPYTNPSRTISGKCSIFGALLSCGNYSGRLLLARDTIRRAQTASFHTYLAPSQAGYFGHQTTCVVSLKRIEKAMYRIILNDKSDRLC